MTDTPRTDDEDFAVWKAERDRRFRTRGKFVLTDEGRKQAREMFDEDSWVLPLLDKVEELERENAALRTALAEVRRFLDDCGPEVNEAGMLDRIDAAMESLRDWSSRVKTALDATQ